MTRTEVTLLEGTALMPFVHRTYSKLVLTGEGRVDTMIPVLVKLTQRCMCVSCRIRQCKTEPDKVFQSANMLWHCRSSVH